MKSERNDFTQGSILKKLSLFMLPILGALVLQAAYGAVDLLVVGRFGSTSGLSAVSTGSQVLNLVTFVVTQFAMGITVLIARYLGEKKPEQIGSVIGGSVVVFALFSVGLFILMVFFARPISILMQAPAEALDLTTSYVRICGGGIFFIVAYNLLAAIFRGLGDSKSPLLFVLVACIVNIFGDLILVAGLHMDASGAAIATVCAQAISVSCAIVILLKKHLPFKIQRSDFRLNNQCQKILSIGLPLALQEFLTQLSFLALCAFINRLGLEASSGYGVACKIVNFAMLIPSSLMQSMASFVSQNVGANNPKRARKTMFTGIGLGLFFGCIVFILVIFKGNLLAALFTSDAAVIQNGFAYLEGFAPETLATAVLFSMVGYFNGNDQTLWVMIQGLIQTLLVRLPMSYYMSIQPNASLTKIGLAAPASTTVGIVLNVLFFFYFTKKQRKNNSL
ncbi:MAG: MATE family efflux transporter [Lachnospiraceae bacterium]